MGQTATQALRILIQHGRLNAWPRAHVGADLFPHQPAKDIGRGGEDGDGRIGNHGRLAGDEFPRQRRRIGEVENPGAAGQGANHQPDRVLQHTLAEFADCKGRGVQLHACISVTLDRPFDDEKQVHPHCLGTGITAPCTSHGGGDEKQPQPRHDQQSRDEEKSLRPDFD